MAKPTKTAEWATGGGADIVEPTLGQKQGGWVVGTKPPNGWFNWWKNLVHLWLVWLDSKFDDPGGDRIGCHGIDSVATASSGTGITGTGGAGGDGVYGIGGTGNGIGVRGDGVGAEPGVSGGADSAGIGPGVRGLASTGGGVGIEAIGDFSNPPVAGAMYVKPQLALPTTGRVGELCVVGTVLYICTATTPTWEKVGLQT